MKRLPIHLLVIGGAACLSVSCTSGGPKVDVAWIGESVSSPQNDTVINESGQALPTLAAQPMAASVSEPAAASGGGMWSQVQRQMAPQHHETPAASSAAAQPILPSASDARTYTVQQGDTLSGIAARHGVSTSALIAYNGLTANPNALRIGQVIRIPGVAAAAGIPRQSTPAPVSSATSYRTYTVAAGDTLSGIAARNGTTVSAIIAANAFTPDQANRLRVGQTIKLPQR